MRAKHRSRMFLLTYGTQLTRLYGRVFPDFFGAPARRRIAHLLGGDSGSPRWRSFCRPTDPLGWEIGDVPEVDVEVTDPEALAPCDGEILDPPIRQHSGYPCSAEYARERRWAVRTLIRPAAGPVAAAPEMVAAGPVVAAPEMVAATDGRASR
jgi:hypothetical protein